MSNKKNNKDTRSSKEASIRTDTQRVLTSCQPPMGLVALYHVGDGINLETIELPVVMLVIQLTNGIEFVHAYVVNTDKVDESNAPIERADKVRGGMFISIVTDEKVSDEER